MGKIKVLVVDDSALAREMLSKGLSRDPEIEVVGTAQDVYAARDKIVFKKPDVLTLDVEMPKMDGVDFLRKLMPQYPLPVIMVSALTAPGAQITLEAMELGAVDFVLKPSSSFGNRLEEMLADLAQKIKVAAFVDVSGYKSKARPSSGSRKRRHLVGGTDKIVALGASTGGTVALRQVIEELPPNFPGTLIVQHMPPKFTKMFADRLNERAKVSVYEAKNGDRVTTGQVLIAPGGQHMRLVRSGGIYTVSCSEGPNINGHCPSVDALFESVAEEAGGNAVGALLTGMGRDGAKGLKTMREHGALTLAQDEASSVVFGMPKEAYELGAVDSLTSLNQMTDALLAKLERISK